MLAHRQGAPLNAAELARSLAVDGIENLLRVAPSRTEASFYRTSAGAEVDLVLDLPGSRRWAVEVKRGRAPSVSRGFHNALEDLQPDRAFVVHSGADRYPKGENIEAIGLGDMAKEIVATFESR